MNMFMRQIFLAVVLSSLALCVRAEETRIGYVNTDRIFKEASIAKQAQAKLEQEFSKREKELNDSGNNLKTAIEKFEREAPTLSESQRLSRQKQLGEQDRDFQRKRREFQEELGARKNEEMQQLVDRANRVIKQFGDTEKYDLIVEGGLYINQKHDITDKVLKAINAAK
jgi:outer membrane protein